MNKISRIIKATALCIRFPFLYPRNRFTGRHRTGALSSITYRLYKESIDEIGVTAKLYKEQIPINILTKWENVFDTKIRLDIENKKLTVSNKKETKEHSLHNLLWRSDRFEILGMNVSFAISGRPNIIIYVKPKDTTDTTNYGFHYETIKLLTNRFKYRLYQIIDWFDDQILDRLLFLPSYTELDDMPDGWRKAFGIQMCKEIKKALKKKKGALRHYRIVQIKEKFGGLRWYDNTYAEEIQAIIRKYEQISFRTCINCGEPAECISTGWISPYCNKCKIEGKTYVPIIEEDA